MSFMGGFAQGLAGGLSDQIQDKRSEFSKSVDTYRQQAHKAYQSYVKTMGEQKQFKRTVDNFAIQHFDGNTDAARSFLEMHNNDVAKANKAVLDYGVPKIVGGGQDGPSMDEQVMGLGFGGQAPEATQANPAQQGVMDHVMSIGKKLFGSVDINDVRSHVAQEMGMSPEQLQGIMSGAGLGQPGFTPVQMEQNRLGLSDLTSADGALLKLATIPDEQLSPGMRAVKAEAIRLNSERNAATAGGVNPFDFIRTSPDGSTAYEPNTRASSQQYRREDYEDNSAAEGAPPPDGFAEGVVLEGPNGDIILRNGQWEYL